MLDLVISECENRVFQINHHPLGSIYHGHHVITFSYWYEKSNKTNESFNRKLLYDEGNYEKLNDYFNFINWNEVFCDLNAIDSFNRWLSIYQSGCELFIPTLIKDNNKRIKDPLWMNMELKRICKRKRDLWFLCRNSNFRNNMLVTEYKQLNSAVKKMVIRNIREFELTQKRIQN